MSSNQKKIGAIFISGKRRRTDDCVITVNDLGDLRRLKRRYNCANRHVLRGLPRGDALNVQAEKVTLKRRCLFTACS